MHILVLCPPQSPVFEPIAQAVFLSFLELGHNVELKQQYESGYDLALFISFYHPWQICKDKTLKIGYHMEPLPWTKGRDKNIKILVAINLCKLYFISV